MKKIIFIHGAFLVVVLAIITGAYLKYGIVARVNGVAITRIDYIKAMERLGGKQTLETMIDDTLILNEGESKGVKIDQKMIDEEIAKIEERLKVQNQTLDTALAAASMTKADLIKQIKMKKIQDILSAPKSEITQAQIDEFLKTNKSMLPVGKSKEELATLAKQQLTAEASQSAASEWLNKIRESAKIDYLK